MNRIEQLAGLCLPVRVEETWPGFDEFLAEYMEPYGLIVIFCGCAACLWYINKYFDAW